MKIRIDIAKNINADLHIQFTCSSGSCIGILKNTQVRPQTGFECDAEIDVNVDLVRDKNAFQTTKNMFSVSFDDLFVYMIGFIESIDDDGMAYFRLANDCLIMVTTIESDKIKQNEWLELRLGHKEVEVSLFS
jgi:hypothetical protein